MPARQETYLDKLIPNARTLVNDYHVDSYFIRLEDLYERKLWHQLTKILDDVFMDPKMKPLFIPLYDLFVLPLRRQLSALSVAFFAVAASHRLAVPDDSLDFVRQATTWLDFDESPQAFTLVKVREAHLLLRQGDIAGTKKLLDKCKLWVETVPVRDRGVLAQYHNLSSDYYDIQRDYRAYYFSTLNFLSCFESVRALPMDMVLDRAEKVAVAGLLAPDLYDLSEMLFHEIWTHLQPRRMDWVVELVRAVQFGDVSRWVRTKPRIMGSLPNAVLHYMPLIEQKICLAALVQCVLKRPPTERTLPFSVIAREVSLQPSGRVEVLLMKAFSLGLLRGRIDGVSKEVHVSWVQPRKMTYEQIIDLRSRIRQWDQDVRNLTEFVSDHGDDVWRAST